ncbi:MAG TPA: AraC family transcriptional regulator [Streptosporangiaceae bacterium]|nr:AraC family transcriptional regulator [Streptosporangiaceae bacterium]
MNQTARPDSPESFAERPNRGPTSDVLSTVLRAVHLSGHDVSEISAGPPETFVQREGFGSVHFVEVGEVHLELAGPERHVLRVGDVALLPMGRPHVLTVRESGTRWLTGTFIYDGPAGHRLLNALPEVIAFDRVRLRGYEWLDVCFRELRKERHQPTPGAAVMISRILDVIYIQLLRLWATHSEASPGWLRAGMNPDIGSLLDSLHANLAHDWSVGEMAHRAHLSRTTFAERFTRILEQPPMAYLTNLRMELARDLLQDSDQSARQIAVRVGYKSDAAFSRAFTRHHGSSPGQWRRDHSTA